MIFLLKIVSLMENMRGDERVTVEHGFSLYIETKNHKILFDTGQSSLFSKNAEILGVDLRCVDILVLSHAHYDHAGGIDEFLKQNDTAKIYINTNAFEDYRNDSGKYIGIDAKLKDNPRVIITQDYLKIDDELSLFTYNDKKRPYKTDNAGQTVFKNDRFLADNYLHEQYLMIYEDQKKVLISGCSHKGILNIMSFASPDVLVGGFHYMKQKITDEGNEILDFAAKKLEEYNTVYYTCHCTGEEQFRYLKYKSEAEINYLACGQKVMI